MSRHAPKGRSVRGGGLGRPREGWQVSLELADRADSTLTPCPPLCLRYRLAGVVTVYSHKRKVFPQLVLRLIGTQRLSYSTDGTSPPEDTEVFRRELELDGSEEEDGDVVIERGIST